MFLLTGFKEEAFCTPTLSLNPSIKIKVDKQWRRLLYFNDDLESRSNSQAIPNEFFLHPRGHLDPAWELEQFLKEIKNKNTHLVCRFPARFEWVEKRNPQITKNFPFVTLCLDTTKFLERVSGVSTGVVFASYYLNNPASIFGHTFLYISKQKSNIEENEQNEMLDSALSYGADTGKAGAIYYFFGGLAGSFPGTTTVLPYYFQVRLYNDYESRDLWKYYLNFTEAETKFLVKHLWELTLVKFPYYFLSKNCSYQLLAILQVVRPEWNLIGKMPFYIIPLDTIRLLDQEKMIAKAQFSPSARFQFRHQSKNLSSEQNKILTELLEAKSSALNQENLSKDDKRKIYDAAIAYYDYRYAKEVLTEDPQILKLKNPILLQRAKLGLISPREQYHDAVNPLLAHPSQRISLSAGQESGSDFIQGQFRFAAHDFLDPPLGHLKTSTLEVGDLQARFKKNKLEISKITVMNFSVLDPWDRWRKKISWSMRFGSERYEINSSQSWFDTGLYPQAGLSTRLFNITPYFLGGPILAHRLIHEGDTKNLGVLGGQINLGIIQNFQDYGSMVFQYSKMKFSDDQNSDFEKMELRFQYYFMKNFSLFGNVDWITSLHRNPNLQLGIHHFF